MAFANGGLFDHGSCGGGQNRGHLQFRSRRNARLAFARLSQFIVSSFATLLAWGFTEASWLLGKPGEASRESDLRMAGFLTTSTQFVVKNAAIRNRLPGAHVFKSKSRPIASADLAPAPSRREGLRFHAEKPASLCRQSA
ncbi:hypothetical protein [Slackia isoflavoniconvertens]|uniref:hypothetical protein n=1 Tax=Slackia isoflavoniconvertens TaxID=572010 RepID=UPI003AF1A112